MVIYPFLGQGPFCLHVLSLGNKGQWIVLERGQMAGFLPVGRLPDPWRPAPGCPAAWSLATSWTTWSPNFTERGVHLCCLFNLEKNVDTYSGFASHLRRNHILLARYCLAGVSLFIQSKWPRFFSRLSEKIWRLTCVSVQLRLTLCNPMDSSPPGSSVYGIPQARILEWVAISFLRGSFQPRDQTCTGR